MTLATVTGTGPLTVRVDGASTSTPAKIVGGVALTPSVNLRVLVAQAAGRLYVMGAA